MGLREEPALPRIRHVGCSGDSMSMVSSSYGTPDSPSAVELQTLGLEAQLQEVRAKLSEMRTLEKKAEKEALQLDRDVADLKHKPSWWKRWRSSFSAAGVASLIATALPVATWIHGTAQTARDLALEREKQLEAARVAYLDRLEKNEERRASVLRFIAATSPDAAMRQWAIDEGKRVEAAQLAIEAKAKQLAEQDTSNESDEGIIEIQAKLAELEARMGRPLVVTHRPPSRVKTVRPGLVVPSQIAVPQNTDSEAPASTPPPITTGRIPYTASSCARFEPSAEMSKGQCLVMCWDKGHGYNIRKTVTAPSEAQCGSVALGACQQAGNSFCGFSWAAAP
jgi:hypothetical protein